MLLGALKWWGGAECECAAKSVKKGDGGGEKGKSEVLIQFFLPDLACGSVPGIFCLTELPRVI